MANGGFYKAASGLLAKDAEVNMYNSNLANLETPGAKERFFELGQFGKGKVGRLDAAGFKTLYESVDGIYAKKMPANFSQGELEETGRSLDFALVGAGFFTLDGGLLTRNGRFMLDDDGYLVGPAGKRVLGVSGEPIFVGTDKFNVDESGRVFVTEEDEEEAKEIGRLLISDAKKGSLTHADNGCFTSNSVVPVNDGFEIVQGSYEESNIDISRQMTSLAEALNHQKVLKNVLDVLATVDENITKNTIGS